jgi:integrase
VVFREAAAAATPTVVDEVVDAEIGDMEKIVRYFMRSTHVSESVFSDEKGLRTTFDLHPRRSTHSRVRKALKPPGAVIDSIRHTFGTRLGEAGADAFTIMRAMGHSSITVNQKYVHPTPEDGAGI